MIDRLLFTIKGVHAALRNCVFFSFVAGALIIIEALCLTTTLVNLWYSHALIEQIPYIAGFLCCLIARQILDNTQAGWLEKFAGQRADEFRDALFEKLFKQGQTLIQEKGTGGFATLLIEGVDQVESYLRMILPRMTKLVVIPMMLLVLLFIFDWVSALIGLLVFPAIILQMVLIGHTASLEAGKQHSEYQRLANHFLDSVRGIDTLKFFGRSKAHAQRIYDSSERFRKATIKTLRVATLSGAVLDAFSTISIAAIAVMLGFRLVDGSLALYPALFVLVIMPDYFKPIREFASDYHASLDGKNSLKSILNVLDGGAVIKASEEIERSNEFESEKYRNEKSQGEKSQTAGTLRAEAKPNKFEKPQMAEEPPTAKDPQAAKESSSEESALPSLELRAISFAYSKPNGETSSSGNMPIANAKSSGSEPNTSSETSESTSTSAPSFVLDNISASFSGAQRVGIIGPSGSGKSTLAHILAGLNNPTSGEIVLNGTAISTLNTASWHHQVAYIPQDPHIFHASLRDNLAFYHPGVSDDALAQVCTMMGLNSLIEELPQGIDTIIGEGGHTLSGGQAQRIAFARAFLKDECKVLIFDEPTAHLDIETELELKEQMLSLMEGKLVFFATHRLHWLSAMDTVLTLRNGKLVAQQTEPQAAQRRTTQRLEHSAASQFAQQTTQGGEPHE